MAAVRHVLLTLPAIAHLATALGFVRQRHSGGGDVGADGSFVRRVEFEHRLRVCNAYPLTAAMDVHVGSKKLTGDKPLAYKACSDFKTALNPGDKLDFKVGDTTTATFSISGLPSNDATLLLVIRRHDAQSTSVAFDSHVYGNLASAQVAVIDTYKGKAVATPRIQDSTVTKGSSRSEELRYDSVVAVNQGAYTVALDDNSGKQIAKGGLVALNKECYVVMRTGVEAAPGQQSFPEELVVFPQSDPHMLHNGAFVARPWASLLAAVLACTIFLG